jgi:hypothetical protein
MTPWEFHDFFPYFDLKEIVGYPHENLSKWRENVPKFDGIESHVIQHIVSFLKHVLKLNVIHENIFTKLLVFSLEMKKRVWVSYFSGPRIICSCANLFIVFFNHSDPHLQKFEDAYEDYMETLQEDK